MTIAIQTSEARFTAIVDATPVTCNFPCNSASHVVVRYGADVVATQGVHYSVALAGDLQSFTVTPIAGFAALSAGIISVSREVPLVQAFDLLERGEIGSSALVSVLDYITMITQQLKTKFDRALFFPYTDAPAARGEMPPSATRASKFFAWDANGVPVATAVVTAGVLATSPFGVAWVALASVASALTNLGFTTVGAVGKLVVAATTKSGARGEIDAIAAADNIAFLGDNTFAGTSGFAGAVTVIAPTVNLNPATKKYVDDAIAALAIPGAIVNQSTTGWTCQVLTAGVLYTTPAGCVGLAIEIVGGGGGGGSNAVGADGSASVFNGVSAAGGIGGGAINTVGGVGGATAGGAGGTSALGAATDRAAGGRGANGLPNIAGSDALGGGGGSSRFGQGGAPGAAAVANSGGGGGGYTTATAANGGGGGGGGGELKSLLINNPPATYAYAIGAGGAAGGASAGAGGSGKIVVWERYNY